MRGNRLAARHTRLPRPRAARHVEAAVAAEVHARRSRDRQEDVLIGAERGPGGLEVMPVDLAPSPVAGEQRATIGLGPAIVVQGQRPFPLPGRRHPRAA